jgi:hypothetical protein
MMCVEANPEVFLKDMTSPKILETTKKNGKMSFLDKLVICVTGPLSLGMVISMCVYQMEENHYKLEQQIKGNKNQ